MNPTQRAATHSLMATLTYGVEIETYGLGIERAAKIVAETLGGTVETVGGYYGTVAAVAPDGRRWLAMYDGSIGGSGGAEVVTPILRGDEDLAVLQTVIRALRAAGARSDAAHQCGIHVHVGVASLGPAAVGRVVKTTAKLDGFIRQACGVSAEREVWCRALHLPTRQSGHVADVAKLGKARTWDDLGLAWYGSRAALVAARGGNHYDGSRYHGLNLHSLFFKNRMTAEFRYFDGTLHAGKIKSYVQLCLAIVAKAATTTAASAAPLVVHTATDALHVLQRLGMYGDRFATVREHLIAAWRPERAAEVA